MEWTIPGTAIRGKRSEVEASIRQIEGMFLGGGMIRSQLASVSGVEPHDIQYLGHLMRRVESLDAGKDWGQEEKGTTEDEMAGWHH